MNRPGDFAVFSNLLDIAVDEASRTALCVAGRVRSFGERDGEERQATTPRQTQTQVPSVISEPVPVGPVVPDVPSVTSS